METKKQIPLPQAAQERALRVGMTAWRKWRVTSGEHKKRHGESGSKAAALQVGAAHYLNPDERNGSTIARGFWAQMEILHEF